MHIWEEAHQVNCNLNARRPRNGAINTISIVCIGVGCLHSYPTSVKSKLLDGIWFCPHCGPPPLLPVWRPLCTQSVSCGVGFDQTALPGYCSDCYAGIRLRCRRYRC